MFATSFKQAATTIHRPMTAGLNGALGESSTGHAAIDFNNTVIQSYTDQKMLMAEVDKVLAINDPEQAHELIATFLNKRYPRGGEGCKEVFWKMFLILYGKFPKTMLEFVPHIPNIGCFKDYWQILLLINTKEKESSMYEPSSNFNETIRFYDFYAPLVERIAESFTDTLKSDIDAVKAFESTYTTEEERKANINKLTISLAGKWAPSEKGSFNKKVHTYIRLPDSKSTSKNTAYLYKQSLTHYLARTMFLPGTLKRFTSTSHPPSLPTQVLKEWRLSKSILDKYLEVPEVNMAANEFNQINLKRATSTFMFKARLALLNEKKKVPLQAHESETGNRHPDNEDRVKCRQMFLENLTKIKGGTLSLAQIYVKFKSARSVTEKKVLEAQFNAKVGDREAVPRLQAGPHQQAYRTARERKVLRGPRAPYQVCRTSEGIRQAGMPAGV